MATAFNFNYRPSGALQNLQPDGDSVIGEKGRPGIIGRYGSTLFYLDADVITSINKSALLSYINNSISLDGSKQLANGYHDGDLILCERMVGTTNYVYQITNKNNIFDITLVGKINAPRNVIKKDNIINGIVNVSLYPKETLSDSKVPVTRSYDFDSSGLTSSNFQYKNHLGEEASTRYIQNASTTYHLANHLLFGFELTPTINTSKNEYADNYDYYLRITLKNTKMILGKNNFPIHFEVSNIFSGRTITEEPVADPTIHPTFTFGKVMEFPLTAKVNGKTRITKQIAYVSDMSADKLHPSGNNITAPFINPLYENEYGIETDARSQYVMLRYPMESARMYVYGFRFRQKLGTSYANIFYEAIGLADYFQTLEDGKYRKALLDQDIVKIAYDLRYGDLGNHTLITYPKITVIHPEDLNTLYPCIIDFMGGESAYFSSMVNDSMFDPTIHGKYYSNINKGLSQPGCFANNTFDEYVGFQRSLSEYTNNSYDNEGDRAKHWSNRVDVAKQYICKKIKEFIFSDENKYELICVNKKSGRVTIIQNVKPNDIG